jgi:hypothetical protein
VPRMFTEVPTDPTLGETRVIPGVSVKVAPLLATPATVNTTGPGPSATPDGTSATTLVLLQLRTVPATLLNVTTLDPCVAPKFTPVIVTEVATGPETGERLEILGGTVNKTPLLATPLAFTMTFPVVAPAGTGATMLPAPQAVGVANMPLKVTVLKPCVVPKFAPVMVTDVPTCPDGGVRPPILGAGTTVKLTPLLATPPAAVTTTLPVVAPFGTEATMLVSLQLVTVACVPLNFAVPFP